MQAKPPICWIDSSRPAPSRPHDVTSLSSSSTTCATSMTRCRESKKRIAEAVAASGTTLTELFGVGPVVAAMVIGYTGDVARFTTRDRYASYTGTAPIEVSSGPRKIHRVSRRGNRQLNHAIHIAAVTQIRHRHSEAAPSSTARSPKARRPRRRCEPSSGASATPSTAKLQLDAQRASGAQQQAREGKQGTTPKPARPALTLNTGSSAKPPPDPTSPYDSPRRHDHRTPRRIPTGTRRST